MNVKVLFLSLVIVLVSSCSRDRAYTSLFFPVFPMCENLVVEYENSYSDYKRNLKFNYVNNAAMSRTHTPIKKILVVDLLDDSELLEKTVRANLNSIFSECTPEFSIMVNDGVIDFSSVYQLVSEFKGSLNEEIVIKIDNDKARIFFHSSKNK